MSPTMEKAPLGSQRWESLFSNPSPGTTRRWPWISRLPSDSIMHQWLILPTVLAGLVRNSLKDPHGFRHRLIKGIFVEIKRVSSPNIKNIELSEIAGIEKAVVAGGGANSGVGPPHISLLIGCPYQCG